MSAGRKEPEVKLFVFPTVEKLGEVTPLPAPAERAWKATPSPPLEDSLPQDINADSTHAFIWRNAQQAAAVVRSILRRNEPGDGPLQGMYGARLVAAFFIALGKGVGALVLRHLDQDEARQVGQAVAGLSEIGHHAGMHALEMVRRKMESGEYLDLGGEQYARDLLGQALGPYEAHRLLVSLDSSGFEVLEKVSPDQIAPFISHEHPQTIALILSQLKPHLGAGILSQLPARLQADVAYRTATMENVTSAALQRIGETLSRVLSEMLSNVQDVGGPKVVADMLNLTGSSVEKNVLDQMDAQDPEVAEAVRNSMFVFDDIKKLTDREIQVLLREVDQKDLVISLKAASEELKQKFLSNMSEKVRTFIQEEMEFLGPMRLSEVEEVQLRIVQQARQLEEQGQITIVRGAEDQFV
jgi:flagellar motor switch protein FliG